LSGFVDELVTHAMKAAGPGETRNMNNNSTPLSPRSLCDIPSGGGTTRSRLLSAAQLREQGVSAAKAAGHSRPGGPWQQLLPGVYLLHQGQPTSEDRLRAVLLYAGRPSAGTARGVPVQVTPEDDGGRPAGEMAMITGHAALALYGFESATPLASLRTIDVLVPRTRRLRSTGCAHLIRTASLPRPEKITGLPVAPVARALADAVAELVDAGSVRSLLTEAVKDGYCEPGAVVRELAQERLLARPHVVGAVDALLAEGRTRAEGRLYEMVRGNGLPEPVWNVDLRLPGGPYLGGVDAYWPEHAVAVELDTRAPRFCGRFDDDAQWEAGAAKREHLERLGITVVHITPRKLRDAPDQQATVVRTALTAAHDRGPAAYVVVLPR
jgi:hypothetical protein